MLALEWAGEALELLPERALYWPRRAALLVSDVHVGKSAAFRAAGVPVPAGDTQSDLARLSAALRRTGARKLLLLGDLFHARSGCDGATLEALAAWRGDHATVEIVLIEGNHDAVDAPLGALGIASAGEVLDLTPLRLMHAPPETCRRPTVAGHVHPAAVVRAGKESVRAPCFWFGRNLALLPAFGVFTGGRSIRARPGERVVLVNQGELVEITPRPARSGRSAPRAR